MRKTAAPPLRKETETLLKQLNAYLAKANVDWAVCGGHAVDLFAGQSTREHKDVDVAVFWDQRDRQLSYVLQGPWRIFEPECGLLREVTCAEDDFQRNDNLWCILRRSSAYQIECDHANYYRIAASRRRQDTLDFIEFLFNKRHAGQFVYKRDESIRCRGAIRQNAAGIPYLAPELVLLYKSGFVKLLDSDLPSDGETVQNVRHDFMAVLPLLENHRKRWLAQALFKAYPNGHEWIGFL